MHGTATYRCDDTRDCIIQFCPPDDEHMYSKHVEAYNKLIIKFTESSWLILINKQKINFHVYGFEYMDRTFKFPNSIVLIHNSSNQ